MQNQVILVALNRSLREANCTPATCDGAEHNLSSGLLRRVLAAPQDSVEAVRLARTRVRRPFRPKLYPRAARRPRLLPNQSRTNLCPAGAYAFTSLRPLIKPLLRRSWRRIRTCYFRFIRSVLYPLELATGGNGGSRTRYLRDCVPALYALSYIPACDTSFVRTLYGTRRTDHGVRCSAPPAWKYHVPSNCSVSSHLW
jgi:hypothetical protein